MNIQNLLKQAQKMQKEVGRVESEINDKVYEHSMGGGAIKVAMKGDLTFQNIWVDEALLEKENKEDLEAMLLSCINETIQQAQNEKDSLMKNITGGVKLPGGF